MTHILEELRARGCVENLSSEELAGKLAQGMVTYYVGFDPTAPSLQLGNLFGIIVMRRLQLAGHRPIALMGGGTGMIGDPSGKSKERVLLDVETIEANLAGQRAELEGLLDFDCGANSCLLVNNYDWLGQFSFIEFLRDVGKRFRMGEMLAKESVKRRLEGEEGMSFTEFTYQMLQAYDFLHLFREHGCTLQCGGGDQWGNVVAGIDLVRKVAGGQAYGLVWPLVTDAQGKKFGKSEGTALFLNPELTSPYQLYQYFVNIDDETVIRYLNYFTFLSLEEIAGLAEQTRTDPAQRAAQRKLAWEVTAYVHGSDAAEGALRASRVLFGGRIENLTDRELLEIFADVPSTLVDRDRLVAGVPLTELLAETVCRSKGEARRLIQQGGVYLNNAPATNPAETVGTGHLAGESILVLRSGKKRYHLVRVS